MASHDFDSMYSRLVACKRRRAALEGEQCDPSKCEIGWCAASQGTSEAVMREARVRKRADSQAIAENPDRARVGRGLRHVRNGKRHP